MTNPQVDVVVDAQRSEKWSNAARAGSEEREHPSDPLALLINPLSC
jgi:hypothetical protein